ncbi:hypothetical protein ACFY36_51190 [Actinoplanes sp. NPDC000266]
MSTPTVRRPAPPTTAGRADTAGEDDTVQAARAVTTGHCDDGSGMCSACLTQYGQLKPAPCEQARWAAAITSHTPASPTGSAPVGEVRAERAAS